MIAATATEIVAQVFILAGALLAVIAGIGILRFRTPYARIHASGKASPVAFVLVAIGAAIELGGGAAAGLSVAVLAIMLTMPLGVHLLFRASYRTEPDHRPEHDELASAPHQPRS